MDCKSIEAYFDDFIIGELDSTLEIQIHEHLSSCDTCQCEIKKRERVFALLRESQKFAPPPDVLRRIRGQLDLRREEKKMWLGLPKTFIYVAAAFFLGIVVMRAVDVLFFVEEEVPGMEMRYAPAKQSPYSEAVQFYAVPAEHLERGPQ